MQERTMSKEAEGREDKVDVSLCSQDCCCCSCCCRARCCACCKHSGDSSITVMRFTDAFPEIKLILLERDGRYIKSRLDFCRRFVTLSDDGGKRKNACLQHER